MNSQPVTETGSRTVRWGLLCGRRFAISAVQLLAVLAAAVGAAASTISGTVYLREGGARTPAAGVAVTARSEDGSEVQTSTDSAGRYRLADLPAKRLVVTVFRPGFFARAVAGGDGTLLVDAAEDVAGADFEVLPGGVVTGRITDRRGEPLEGAQVTLFPAKDAGAAAATAKTDDRGFYRAFGLEPGGYLVQTKQAGRLWTESLGTVYYPGVPDQARATEIEVAAGSETTHIDLVLEPEAAFVWQPPPADAPKASIAGRVVSAETGEAIQGAQLRLFTTTATTNDKPFSASAVSGPDGSFSFQGLLPETYSLGAAKSSQWPAQPLPLHIPLEKDRARTGIEIRFHRAPAISGRLMDSDGLPVIGAAVTLHRIVWSEGRRVLVNAGSSHTDDRGDYRLYGLYAGRFLISAAPLPLPGVGGADRSNLARAFYPTGGTASQALPLDIRWGQDLVAINFLFRSQPTFHITGRVIDAATGGPCGTCRIVAAALESGFEIPLPPVAITPAGSYRLGGLTPSAYRVSVTQNAGGPGGRLAVSSQRVQITDGNMTAVDLLTGVLTSVAGRVVLQSSPEDLKLPDLEIRFRPAEGVGHAEEAEVGETLSFEAQLSPQAYNVSLGGLPEGAYLKSLRLGGQVLPGPQIEVARGGVPGELEVILAFDSSVLSARVRPPRSPDAGRLPADVAVLLFPQDGESSFLVPRSASADSWGGFQLNGIAPGRYLAYALSEQDLPLWQDPDFRRRAPVSGTLIELRPGSMESVELIVAPSADAI